MIVRTVGPIDRAKLGAPELCPECGGRLQPMFGMLITDEGTRIPKVDPTQAQCGDCRTVFRVERGDDALPEDVS